MAPSSGNYKIKKNIRKSISDSTAYYEGSLTTFIYKLGDPAKLGYPAETI